MEEITAHGLRHSAVTILLNQVGKDLREIQELLPHKNIRTTVRCTHVGMNRSGRERKRSARIWSEVGEAQGRNSASLEYSLVMRPELTLRQTTPTTTLRDSPGTSAAIDSVLSLDPMLRLPRMAPPNC